MRPSTSERKGPAFKPQMRVCYLCGQQFGSASLGIHVPQCYTKKRAQWEAGDPSVRGKAPKHPDTVNWQNSDKTVQEANDEQYSEFSNNLEPCPNCGRKFLADRLVVHLRSCKSAGGSKPVRGREGERPQSQGAGGGCGRPSTSERKGPAFKPQMRVCYLCGQQFGSASLGIHVPQCYTKKRAQWEAGDPETRGKAPKHPDTVNWQNSDKTVQEANDEQYSEFSNNLEPCPHCGRKFLADRLVVHLRSCKPGAGSRPVERRSTGDGPPTTSAPPRAQTSSPGQGSGASGRLGGGAPPSATRQTYASDRDAPRRSTPQGSNVVPKKLPPKLRALQRILFEECDVNQDGFIDMSELRQLIRGVAGEGSEHEAEELMQSLDLNGDGLIDQEEWNRMATATGESLKPLRNRLPSGAGVGTGRSCQSCKAVEHDVRAKFCRDCGTPFDPPTRATEARSSVCRACGEMYPDGSRFCPTCGEPVNNAGAAERAAGTMNENSESVRMERCSGCGAICDSETNFCDNCGAMLSTPPQAPSEGAVRRECVACGVAYDDEDIRFCEECGQTLTVFQPPPRQAPARPAPQPNSNGNAPQRVPGSTAPRWSDEPPQTKTLPRARGAPATKVVAEMEEGDDDDDEGFDGPAPAGGDDGSRVPCEHCGRRFAPESLARHESVCRRQSSRKVFDSRKARMEGTDAAGYIRKVNTRADGAASRPKKDWKAESEAFRRAMREARVVDKVLSKGGTAKDLPPPTYSENAHYTPCPHCGRKFAPDVAERHIPKCATTINKPKAPPRRR